MLFQQLQRVGVALQALSGDGGEAGQTGVAHLAEVFAGLDCANVDLHSRDGDGFERVQDGHACVRVGGRVDDDAVDLSVSLLDLVDDAALVVGLEDLDLVEANEAFAAQAVYCCRELGFDMDKVNIHGGAIALGHPIGCSGARIVVTLLYALAEPEINGKYGLASLCIGGGQGTAIIVERL